MAGYVFENLQEGQAASFGPQDTLLFSNASTTASSVRVAPFTNNGTLTGTGITLTVGDQSVTFNQNIADASQAGRVIFQDNSQLLIGTQLNTPDNLTPTFDSGTGNPGGGGSGDEGGLATDPFNVFALSGDDTINFSTAAAGVNNYLNGGFGRDTIDGGAANNHIYGNSIGLQAGASENGQADGGDTINVTTGSNYINGNGGADEITVTAEDTSTGYNRIFGGADNDTVTLVGNGLATVNGNTGNDTIDASGYIGDVTLRGGQGDDTITTGGRLNVVNGDLGNDRIIVSVNAEEGTDTFQHIVSLTGGAGSDTFDFSAAGAGQPALFGQATYFQRVTDFDVTNDKFILSVGDTFDNPAQVGMSETTYTSVAEAANFAQNQLAPSDDNTNDQALVSVLEVDGIGTFVFYLDDAVQKVTASQIEGLGVIQLDNVTASSVTYDNFTNFAGTTPTDPATPA